MKLIEAGENEGGTHTAMILGNSEEIKALGDLLYQEVCVESAVAGGVASLEVRRYLLYRKNGRDVVTLDWRGPGSWTICHWDGDVLSRDGEWEFDGGRTEEFKMRTRYATPVSALAVWEKYKGVPA